jgi:hypothetical protein
MAVAGGKMPLGHTQKQISIIGSDLVGLFCWHKKITPFFLLYHNPAPMSSFFCKVFQRRGKTEKQHRRV